MADSSSRPRRYRRYPFHFHPAVQALFDDLAGHFQISRNANQVGTILVNLLHTDFAFGLASHNLNILRGNQDALLAKMAQIEVNVTIFCIGFYVLSADLNGDVKIPCMHNPLPLCVCLLSAKMSLVWSHCCLHRLPTACLKHKRATRVAWLQRNCREDPLRRWRKSKIATF